MPARKLNQRPTVPLNAPLYGERERTLILRFLASLTLDAMYYIKGIREFAGEDLLQEQYQRQIRFHNQRIETYRQAAIKACKKQRHLLEMNDDMFQGIINEWHLPYKE